jgi:hypothetical protein
MAGRIPIYRRVGDALQMRPERADRGICTSCHEMPSRALPPTTAQLSERRKGAALDLASLRTSQLQLAFRGRIGKARDQIAIAHDALSDMDIAVFAERARRELSATSGRRGRRNSAAPSAQVTGQELQIAQLVQQGLSNREIGCLNRPDDPPRRAQKRAGPGNRHPCLDRELEPESASIHLDQDR